MKEHAIIIGGTRGIGSAIASKLLHQSYRVSILGAHEPKKRLPHASYWITDIINNIEHVKLLKEITQTNGPITHLVFCQKFRGLEQEWDNEILTTISFTKKFIESSLQFFHSRNNNSIVVLSSVASFIIGSEQPVGYHVAKAGLNQLVRYYAALLGPKNIRVNAISPCTILKKESAKFYAQHKQLKELYMRIVPLKRMGTAENIADIVYFLCSPASSFITGINLVADGGLTLISQEALARELTHNTKVTLRNLK